MKKLILLLLLLPIGVHAQNQARMISGTNNITTCPYTIQKQDVTKLDVFLSSTACAVTLPAATVQGFGKGSIFSVKNNGSGSVTITPTGELIDGNASVTLLPGAGMDIYSTGTGYSSQPGSGSGGGGGGGINPPAGDIGGNAVVPLVISTHLNSPLPILQGGTGTQTPGSVAGTGITITGTWPNETISGLSACWQNNGSALTCEPFTNAVPPLVATLNVGNSTIDLTCPAAVGVGGSHASGCVPDPGASGTTTDYLGRDMAYHTAVGASTILPDPATAIQYVAGTCNGGSACTDANNGLSWGAAKLTISAAVQALPGGGGGTAGKGTVFVGVGAVPNAAGNQYGMWFMASADPNFGSPPTGWLKCTGGGGACDLNIVGVPNGPGAPNPHEPRVLMNLGSQIVTTTPAIWLSDVATMHFSNMQFQYPGRAFVMGECSDGTRTGTCPVTGVTFDNMGALLNQTATNGPCTDITGQSYWLWFKDFGCGGNAIAATGGRFANNAAAVLVDDSLDNGSGLIHIRDANFSAGGIKVIPGVNGSGLYAENITEEGDFTHDIPPAVWFTSFPAQTDCRVSNIQIADAGPSGVQAVRNDGGIPGCTVINTLSPSPVLGAAVILNSDPRGVTNSTTSPLSQKQVGFFNGYVVGQTNVARRIAGLVPSRFINSAQSNPASWTASAATITTGQTDPFGGTQAGLIASGSSGSVNFSGGCGAYTPVAGDWIVMGAWKKDTVTPPTGATIAIQNCGFPAITFSAQYNNGAMMKGDGQWAFAWTAYKVGSGSATQAGVGMVVTSASSSTAYGPIFSVIPNGTLSDNEVLEFASAMGSGDSTCKVGSVCNVNGHPVSADVFSVRSPTGTVLNISAPSVASSRTITAADPLGSAALPLMTGTITNAANVCASGTAGLITTVGCTGGGGGAGTVIAALQNSLTYYDQPGTIAHVAGVSGPTGPNSVPSFWVTIPSGSAATAPQPILAGIPGRTVAGASDTILATDRVSTVTYTNAGATAVSLPGAGTTGFTSNFCFKMIVQGAGDVVTITPGAGTINGSGTATVLQGQKALICSFDNSNYIATIADPPAAAGTNIALTRGDASLSFASSAGGGTVTHTGALTAGLVVGNGTADVTIGNLSGDCTTAVLVLTCTALNGGAFTGTNGNLVSFGASNVPADSTVVAANVITSTGSLGSGNLVSGASPKTVTDSGVSLANVVTAASNSAGTNQILAATTTTKAGAFKSFADLTATNYAGVATNSGDDYTACPSTNPATSLATNLTVSFKVSAANTTTTPTLNLCTLGAKTITKAPGTSAVAANDIVTNAIITVKYDGTNMQLQNPQTTSAGGTALSSVTAAAATNTLANANFPQTWNSQQTTNSQNAFTFGESGASTNGTVTNNLANQANLRAASASNSTATPLSVVQGSVTGTTAYPAFQVKSTWNNAGLVAQGVVISVTDTAHGSGAKLLNVLGGASGTTSLLSVDPSGNLTVPSCTGCVSSTSLANYLGGTAISRWGTLVWSHANGGINTLGSFVSSGGNVCTTAGDTAATVTDPPYKTCGTGAVANTTQFLGMANGDAAIGSSSNPNNLHISTFAKISALTTTRAWLAEISNAGTLATLNSDTPTGSNLAGIRFSSVAGDTNYMMVLCNAAACNATSTGVAADTSKHHFEIRMDDAAGIATGCVDGTCVTSSTDYPNSGVTGGFGLGLVIDNTTTTVETLSWSGTTVTSIN